MFLMKTPEFEVLYPLGPGALPGIFAFVFLIALVALLALYGRDSGAERELKTRRALFGFGFVAIFVGMFGSLSVVAASMIASHNADEDNGKRFIAWMSDNYDIDVDETALGTFIGSGSEVTLDGEIVNVRMSQQAREESPEGVTRTYILVVEEPVSNVR